MRTFVDLQLDLVSAPTCDRNEESWIRLLAEELLDINQGQRCNERIIARSIQIYLDKQVLPITTPFKQFRNYEHTGLILINGLAFIVTESGQVCRRSTLHPIIIELINRISPIFSINLPQDKVPSSIADDSYMKFVNGNASVNGKLLQFESIIQLIRQSLQLYNPELSVQLLTAIINSMPIDEWNDEFASLFLGKGFIPIEVKEFFIETVLTKKLLLSSINLTKIIDMALELKRRDFLISLFSFICESHTNFELQDAKSIIFHFTNAIIVFSLHKEILELLHGSHRDYSNLIGEYFLTFLLRGFNNQDRLTYWYLLKSDNRYSQLIRDYWNRI